MLESVFYAFCLIFALLGLYYVSDSLYRHLLCERNCKDIYTVIFNFEDDELLPDKVYSAMLLSSYLPFGKRKVYVIDSGQPEHIKLKCNLITADMGTVHFIKKEDLNGLYKINASDD